MITAIYISIVFYFVIIILYGIFKHTYFYVSKVEKTETSEIIVLIPTITYYRRKKVGWDKTYHYELIVCFARTRLVKGFLLGRKKF